MESEKVKEIKKALGCCINKECGSCPRLNKKPYHLDDCRFALLLNLTTLINELESEKDKYKNLCETMYRKYCKLEAETYTKEDVKEFKDRIAELEKENESLYDSYHKGYKVGYEYGKQDEVSSDRAESDNQTSETTQTEWKLKQFAERLKEKLKDNVNSSNVDNYVECARFITETLGEFTNGKE